MLWHTKECNLLKAVATGESIRVDGLHGCRNCKLLKSIAIAESITSDTVESFRKLNLLQFGATRKGKAANSGDCLRHYNHSGIGHA